MTDLTTELGPRLQRALAGRRPIAAPEDGAQRAAVAVVVTTCADPSILFVRRQEREGDPWSGHIAFPGGFSSDTDGSVERTAEREAEEETGLDLRRRGVMIGLLDDVAPRSVHLPRITVTPVVFLVDLRLPVEAGPEVAEATWLSASAVFDPANRHPHEITLSSGPRTFDAIRVGDYTIWGLTERVLAQVPSLLGLEVLRAPPAGDETA